MTTPITTNERATPKVKRAPARKQSLAIYDEQWDGLEVLRLHYGLHSRSETARFVIDNALLVMAHEQARRERAA